MKEIQSTQTLYVYEDVEELPTDVHHLMKNAVEAREKAYAPYSKFNVGAAILLEDGAIITGNNQENAAYPSGLCAERVAIFHYGATYPDIKILKIAVTARSQNQIIRLPVPPCGACRQAIAEYEIKQEQPIEIYFMGEKGNVVKVPSVKVLLPMMFDQTYL